MENFDVKKNIEFQLNNNAETFLGCFAGSVGTEVAKISIGHKLTTKTHKFSNGEGEIAESLTIVINFNDAVVQPHSDFEDEFCSAIVDVLASEVNGLYENADFDEDEVNADE